MEVEKILQEISSYSFSEDIFSFLLQKSKKYSTLSLLKHMLFSVINCAPFVFLLSSFYHLERGEDCLEEIIIRYHNREIKRTKKEFLLERNEKLKKVVNDFVNGEGTLLKEILSYGKAIFSFSSIYDQTMELELEKKLVLYEHLLMKFNAYDEHLLSFRKLKKDAQRDLKKKVPLVLYDRKILKNGEEKEKKKVYKFFKTFAYRKYAMKIDLKIEALKKEKNALKEEENKLLQEIGALFSSKEGTVFWEAILNKYEYYNRNISLQEILQTVLLVGKNYKELESDLSTCFKVIQSYPKLCGYIKNGNVLTFVCKKIRESYEEASKIPWDVHVRKVDVPKEKNSFYRVYGYLELPSKMEELSKVFLDLLKEKDSISFIKKCASFYLDLLIVQPYQVGNDKTARFLLSLMLLLHGIILPCSFVVANQMSYKSNLCKTYGEMEQELLTRYFLFYPNVQK